MYASRWGDTETVKVILAAYPASCRLSVLKHENKDGDTVLMYASRWGGVETVKVILEAYPASDRLSVLKDENKHGDTVLIFASKGGDAETVQGILETYSNNDRLSALQHVCKAGRTALFYAVSHGNADAVTVLLSALPCADRVQAISHMDHDGSKSITALCVENFRIDYHRRDFTKFKSTIRALFMPLSYAERLSILGYTESEGYTALMPITKLDKNFVMEQLKKGALPQTGLYFQSQSIFSRFVSARPPSNEIVCRLS